MSEKLSEQPQGSEYLQSEKAKERARQARINELADINAADFQAEQERVSEEFPDDVREKVEGIDREDINDLREELKSFIDTEIPKALTSLGVRHEVKDKILDVVYQDHVDEALEAIYPIPKDGEDHQDIVERRNHARELLLMPADDFSDMSEKWQHYEEVQAAAEVREARETTEQLESDASTESQQEADSEREENRKILSDVDADKLLEDLSARLGLEHSPSSSTPEESTEQSEAQGAESDSSTAKEKIANLTDKEREDRIESLMADLVQTAKSGSEHEPGAERGGSIDEILNKMAELIALYTEEKVRNIIDSENNNSRPNETEETEVVERDTGETSPPPEESAENEEPKNETAGERRKQSLKERLKNAAAALKSPSWDGSPGRFSRAWQEFRRKETTDNELFTYDEKNEVDPAKRKRKVIGWAIGATAVLAAGVVWLATRDPDSAMQAQEGFNSLKPNWPDVTNSINGIDSNTIPAHEFSEAARMATEGEGWLNTIQEATGINNGGQMRTILDEVGPRLVEMGEAYEDPSIGGFGISRPGQLSDAALNLIRDTAIRHGFIT